MTIDPTDEECPDCGTRPGRHHHSHCDVPLCTECGRQKLTCWDHPNAHPQKWTGDWPGSQECYLWGFLDAEGMPDLGQLYRGAHWDRATQRWVLELR